MAMIKWRTKKRTPLHGNVHAEIMQTLMKSPNRESNLRDELSKFSAAI